MSTHPPEQALLSGFTGTFDRAQRDFWAMIRKAKTQYIVDHVSPGVKMTEIDNGFYYYLQHTYGIKLQFDNSGKIKLQYDIIDEPAYLVFMLKYQ